MERRHSCTQAKRKSSPTDSQNYFFAAQLWEKLFARRFKLNGWRFVSGEVDIGEIAIPSRNFPEKTHPHRVAKSGLSFAAYLGATRSLSGSGPRRLARLHRSIMGSCR